MPEPPPAPSTRFFPRLAIALLIMSAPAAFPPAAAQTGAILDTLRSFVAIEAARQRITGLSIAVVVDDQLVWSEGFGFADLEAGAPATGSTLYRIGSVSKPVVGTALMQLVEQGRVDLEAEIQTYVPEFPRKRWPVTVRHLLTHTSGIRHYRGDEFYSMTRYDDLLAPLQIFAADTLLFEPGTQYSYSTYGFNLVANIVANVSGMEIEEYMRRYVYEPAWMNSTAAEDASAIRRGRARWYERRDGRLINAPYVDLSNKYAGGGITSTAEDLCRLHIAYARGKLLSPETIEEMYEPQTLADGTAHGYGLAWRVSTQLLPDSTRARQVSHSGSSVGANTLFVRYPDQGFAVAVISNQSANLGRIVNGVIRLFADAGTFRRHP